ncbi:MAG: molybdate ABC transporter permease subunit [Planctomycetota bacterium]
MTLRGRIVPLPIWGVGLAAVMMGLMVLPLVSLLLSSSFENIFGAVRHPMFAPALALSLRTTAVSLTIIVVLGTPLAWWLAAADSPSRRMVQTFIDLPIVVPPAVVGVALLQTFSPQGWLGPLLLKVGITVSFTERAVILAQVVVAAPFFIQAGTNAFRKVEPDILIVARSLGASPWAAFRRVAVPIAWPGLTSGASLAGARALGEFGATLLFAGNMTGRTQTLPLAIFTALESDVRLAVVLSLVLVAVGAVVLGLLRLTWWRR